MKTKAKAHILSALAASSAYVFGSAGASAQTPSGMGDAAQATADEHGSAVETIIVTAQRRSENIQTVPIAITALSGDLAAKLGAMRTSDLAKVVPALVITTVNNTPLLFVRGVGTPGSLPGVESTVGVYLDGVYLPIPTSALFSLDGIERVEVLKGPQGTLFGRNNTGGVIQIITKTPSQTPETMFHAGYGNYDTYEVGGYINRPINEKVAVNLSGHWKNQRDGWGTDLFDGTPAYRNKEYIVRGKLKVDPGDGTSMIFSGDYGYSVGDSASARTVPPTIPFDRISIPGFYEITQNSSRTQSAKSYGGSLTVEHSFSSAALTSITSYRRFKDRHDQDADYSSASILFATVPHTVDTYSQELRLASNTQSAFKWLAGLYYIDSKTSMVFSQVSGAIVPPGGLAVRANQVSTSYAAFAQGSLAFNEHATLTLGSRYTYDKKTIEGATYLIASGTVLAPAKKHNFVKRAPTWRIAFDYKIGDFMPYISYDHGFRSGQFNITNPGAAAIDPEYVDQYEIGLKGALFDRRLIFSSAIFYIHAKNLQLSAATSTGGVSTFNATSATIKGGEFEVTARPFDDLTLRTGIAIQDGQYGNFLNAPKYDAAPTGGNTVTFINAKDNDTIRTPHFVSNISAEYHIPTTSLGEFRVIAGYYHSSQYFADVANTLKQNAYDVVNASVGWSSPSRVYDVSLWARNLFGEKYYARLDSSGLGNVVSAAEPRVYGVTATARF